MYLIILTVFESFLIVSCCTLPCSKEKEEHEFDYALPYSSIPTTTDPVTSPTPAFAQASRAANIPPAVRIQVAPAQARHI